MAVSTQEIMLGSSSRLCEGSGKFWSSDSDLECEDLGDADALAQGVALSAPRQAAAAAVVALRNLPLVTASQPVAKASRPPSPRRIQVPWKRIWMGPLSPHRITPAATIGEFILPTLQSSA